MQHRDKDQLSFERKPIRHMSTVTTIDTSMNTGQHTPTRTSQRESQQPVSQQERSAAQRLRTTMAA